MDSTINQIDAYILTGGQSRRFGEPKCLVKLTGKSLTEIVNQNLISIFNSVKIIGKENHFPDYNFVEDVHPIQCPLNGITTALEHSKTEWVFVIACDTPLINTNTINYLYGKMDSNKQTVIPFVVDRLQPLCAFYHNSVLKKFNTAIDKGDYSLMRLLKQIEMVKVLIPSENEEQFLNINYPEDLERAEEMLEKINKIQII